MDDHGTTNGVLEAPLDALGCGTLLPCPDAALEQARRAAAGEVADYLAAAHRAVAVCGAAGERVPSLAAALSELGNAHRMHGDHAAALTALGRAIEIARGESAAPERERILATAHQRSAIVHDALGEFASAVAQLRQAHAGFESIGDATGLASVHNSLGIVYSRTGDVERALEFYRLSVDHAERVGDDVRLASALTNISITTRLMGRNEESIVAAQRACDLACTLLDRAMAASSHTNLALALAAAGRSAEAREAFETGSGLHRALGDRFFEAEHDRCYGEFLQARGEHAAALVRLSASLACATEIAAMGAVKDAHEALARLHKERGAYRLALEHFEQFHEISRQLDQESAARELRTQKGQYELDLARRDAHRARAESEALASGYTRLEALHASLERRALELEVRSRLDDLTGIANRGAFEARLRDEADIARASGTAFSLVLLDLDGFKAVNDTHGHAVGDAVLRVVGGVLRDAVRETDCAARLGGEEFAILLAGASASGTATVAEKLRAAIATYGWGSLQQGLRVTASLGTAVSREVDGDGTRLLALADARLYGAKGAGRDRVVATPDAALTRG